MSTMKPTLQSIIWQGNSKTELLAFPDDAKQAAGYQLHRLQTGQTPLDWKPLKNLGKGTTGVFEIRLWSDDGTYRVAYVSKLSQGITVLHCWQKTTQATAEADK